MCVLKLLQASGDDRHLVNLVSVAAAGQIVDRRIQTLQNRAVSSVAAQTLSDLIADVASLDRREDEGVSLTSNRRALHLVAATTGDTAASNCSSPSIASSGSSP